MLWRRLEETINGAVKGRPSECADPYGCHDDEGADGDERGDFLDEFGHDWLRCFCYEPYMFYFCSFVNRNEPKCLLMQLRWSTGLTKGCRRQ